MLLLRWIGGGSFIQCEGGSPRLHGFSSTGGPDSTRNPSACVRWVFWEVCRLRICRHCSQRSSSYCCRACACRWLSSSTAMGHVFHSCVLEELGNIESSKLLWVVVQSCTTALAAAASVLRSACRVVPNIESTRAICIACVSNRDQPHAGPS